MAADRLTGAIGHRRAAALGIVLALLANAAVPARATVVVPNREMQIEAAFLVNFVRYTDWPRTSFGAPDAPYVVTVVGSDQVAETVGQVAAAAGPVRGRPMQVRRFDAASLRGRPSATRAALATLRESQLVFVSASANVPAGEIVDALRGSPVLTVGDGEGFVAAGGMLGLFVLESHLAFEADPVAIQAAGLLLSAKVLKLARVSAGER